MVVSGSEWWFSAMVGPGIKNTRASEPSDAKVVGVVWVGGGCTGKVAVAGGSKLVLKGVWGELNGSGGVSLTLLKRPLP